jgi:hypothetical protein
MIPILLTWITSEEVNRPPSGFRAYPFAEQSANCVKIDTERRFSDDRNNVNSDLRRQPPDFKTFSETDFTVRRSIFFERHNGDFVIPDGPDRWLQYPNSRSSRWIRIYNGMGVRLHLILRIKSTISRYGSQLMSLRPQMAFRNHSGVRRNFKISKTNIGKC